MGKRIALRFGPGRLALKYPSQNKPQDIYCEIHDSGDVWIEANVEIGNAVPFNVWHGITRRVTLHNIETKADARRWYAQNKADIRAVVNGMSQEWNGSNYIGRLTSSAQAALDRLEYNSYEWEGR